MTGQALDVQMLGSGAPAFPQFLDLPLELRLHIWKLFCPELHGRPRRTSAVRGNRPRVFPVELVTDPSQTDGTPYIIRPTPSLKQQTATARTLLAVHRESRNEAERSFPDWFAVNQGSGIVRFNAKDDVVFLDGRFEAEWMERSWNHHTEDFSDEIVNLALGPDFQDFYHRYSGPSIGEFVDPIWSVVLFLNPFTELRFLYYCCDHTTPSLGDYELRWCASDSVHRYHPMPAQEHAQQVMYCWPDLCSSSGWEYAENEPTIWDVDLDLASEELRIMLDLLFGESNWPEDQKIHARKLLGPLSQVDRESIKEIQTWKMVRFIGESGLRRFHSLIAHEPGEKIPPAVSPQRSEPSVSGSDSGSGESDVEDDSAEDVVKGSKSEGDDAQDGIAPNNEENDHEEIVSLPNRSVST